MPPKKQAIVSTNPLFRFVVWIVIVLAISTLTVWICVAFLAGEKPSIIQQRLADGCETVFKMAAGALIGLIGGRAGTPDRIELSDERTIQPGSKKN